MEITLLGSGDAIGIPVPMCNCKYCQKSEKRRRPGLLIESEESSIVFEISPEIKEQLYEVEVYDVDAFFVTHSHFDHFAGIRELNHIAIEQHVLNPEEFDYNRRHGRKITVYGNSKTRNYLQDKHSHIADNENINFSLMAPEETVRIGDIEVEAFEVEHAEKTQDYVIRKDGKKIVYAPDVRNLPENKEAYKNADILFIEGSLFGAESHGYTREIEKNIELAEAERTVLVNISEHLNQKHTDQLQKEAENRDCEIWSDFESTEL